MVCWGVTTYRFLCPDSMMEGMADGRLGESKFTGYVLHEVSQVLGIFNDKIKIQK